MRPTRNAFVFSFFAFISCSTNTPKIEIETVDWEKRELAFIPADSALEKGSTYLSIYSQIYSQSEKNTRDLTVTVSIRNPDAKDTLFLKSIKSYDTEGNEIKKYIQNVVFVRPMETLELVIEEQDTHNGTGGNFVFDWMIKKERNEPFFEAVMISTAGQQGISFVTTGKRIK